MYKYPLMADNTAWDVIDRKTYVTVDSGFGIGITYRVTCHKTNGIVT